MKTLRNKIGIVYHGRHEPAIALSEHLATAARKLVPNVWRAAAASESEIKANAVDSELVLSVGGDGTLLRAARGIAGSLAPIIGVNLGKLGFMTELTAAEAIDKLPLLLRGDGWTDTRAMLDARVASTRNSYVALNDIVLGRGGTCRMVRVEAKIDAKPLTVYRVDGIIVATATGSTSYALAAGGPVLYPHSRDILLQPISPHLSLSHCLVLAPETVIELTVRTDRPGTISIDGQVDLPLKDGETVTVSLSDKVVRFLRLRPPACFYESLVQKLKGEPTC